MKTYTPLERDTPVDPLAAIRAARQANNLPLAHDLLKAQATKAGGQVSGLLAYEWALLLMADKQYDEARDVLALFLASYPDLASAWFLLGQCSEVQGDYVVAEGAFRESVRAHKRKHGQPDMARSYFSLGSNLFRLGRPLEAEDNWRKGLRGECSTPEALFVRSQVLLAFGDYEQGWKDYENRRTLPGWQTSVRAFVGDRELPPEWDGKSEGAVWVYGEQGAGDAIMFSRYTDHMPQYFGMGPRITLGPDLSEWLGNDSAKEPVWSVPVGSLPLKLGIVEPIPPSLIYEAPYKKPSNPKPRVGVCWKGASAHLNDKDRSSPIDFREALGDERWEIVSLQYGYDFQPKDYRETAELMRTLDAVISVDTSTIHVAGTLGVPTVLIPPASPEWRWGLGDTTPWYPSIKIVRRKRVDAWPEAIERAKQKLVEMI